MNFSVKFNREKAVGDVVDPAGFPYLFIVGSDKFIIAIINNYMMYSQSKNKNVCMIGNYNMRYNYRYIDNQEIVDRINSITKSDQLIEYFNTNELFRQEIFRVIDVMEQFYNDLVELRDYQIIPCEYGNIMKQKIICSSNELHISHYGFPSLIIKDGKPIIFICKDIEIAADSLVGLGEANLELKQDDLVMTFNDKYLYSTFVDLLSIINEKMNKYMYRTVKSKSARTVINSV